MSLIFRVPRDMNWLWRNTCEACCKPLASMSPGRKNLMCNGHMDTSNTGKEDFLTGIGYKPRAIVKNGMIYGLGIYNMKGALVCYTQALKALQKAGVNLNGDIVLAAVVGEIEKT